MGTGQQLLQSRPGGYSTDNSFPSARSDISRNLQVKVVRLSVLLKAIVFLADVVGKASRDPLFEDFSASRALGAYPRRASRI